MLTKRLQTCQERLNARDASTGLHDELTSVRVRVERIESQLSSLADRKGRRL